MSGPEESSQPRIRPEGEGDDKNVDSGTAVGGQMFLRRPLQDSPFVRGDLLSGRYEVEKLLGHGATGSVMQVFDRVTRTVIAAKILKPELAADPRWVERLGGELRYARKLHHPNVCRVYDLGEANGHHFLTMEFAAGGSLRQRLQEGAERTFAERIVDARAILDGMAAIHDTEIVHRDVKPENVLVMEDGRLVVTDFGVAVTLGQATFFGSQVAGTPAYMAPETVMNEKATKTSDVWSLGVLLHEILFGRRPEWETTKAGRFLKLPVGRKAPTIERAVARVVGECLQELSPRRLSDAAAVKRRFEAAVQGRLRPVAGWIRVRWWIPVVAAALALAAIARSRSPKEPAVSKASAALQLTGEAIDLGTGSRLVMSASEGVRCAQLIGNGRQVRLVWASRSRPVDVDLESGRTSPASLLPETYEFECPQLSPDGRSLLFTRRGGNDQRRIMLSHTADGSGAEELTEGNRPIWLPSGNEFVFDSDSRRAGIYTLAGKRILFPDSPPAQKTLFDKAVDDRSERVALLFREKSMQTRVEIYDYASLSLLETMAFDLRINWISFDPARRRFQISAEEPARRTVAELSTGRAERIARFAGADIHRIMRATNGLAFLTNKATNSIFLKSPDGEEKLLFTPGAFFQPSASSTGDVLAQQKLSDGRWIIVASSRPGEVRALTEGPEDAQPAFVGRRSFAYLSLRQNAVVLCALVDRGAPTCRQLLTDPLAPSALFPSPDGSLIGYLTNYGSSLRIRVMPSSGGDMRDLASATLGCIPSWATDHSLWIYSPAQKGWVETEALTGAVTGRVHATKATKQSPCPDRPAGDDNPSYRLRVDTSRSTELRLTDALR